MRKSTKAQIASAKCDLINSIIFIAMSVVVMSVVVMSVVVMSVVVMMFVEWMFVVGKSPELF